MSRTSFTSHPGFNLEKTKEQIGQGVFKDEEYVETLVALVESVPDLEKVGEITLYPQNYTRINDFGRQYATSYSIQFIQMGCTGSMNCPEVTF